MINRFTKLSARFNLLTFSINKYSNQSPKFSKFAYELKLDKDFLDFSKKVAIREKKTSNIYLLTIGITLTTVFLGIIIFILQDSKRQRLILQKSIIQYNMLQLNPQKKLEKYQSIINSIAIYCQKYINKHRINNPLLKREINFCINEGAMIKEVQSDFIKIINLSAMLTNRKLIKMLPNYEKVIAFSLEKQIKGLQNICHILCQNGNLRQQYIAIIYLKKFKYKLTDKKKQIILERVKQNQIQNKNIYENYSQKYQLLNYIKQIQKDWSNKIKLNLNNHL